MKIKYFTKKLLCFLLSCFLLAGSLTVSAAENTDKGSPNGVPAVPALSHDNYSGAAAYQVKFDIWWGNNATSYVLYENNTAVDEGSLEADSPNAQSKSFSFEKTENGSYSYKIEVTNSYGTTSSNTISVEVTQAVAAPEQPDPEQPEIPEPEQPETPDTSIVEAPVFSPAEGTYASPQSVEITCSTLDAVIYYTLDGTEPSAESTLYGGGFTVDKTTLVKAIAVKEGFQDSPVVSSSYVIREEPANPGKPTEGLSKHLLIGYWHTWGGDASGGVPFLKLRDVDPNWDVINISFAEPAAAGSTDGKMKFVISGLTADYTKEDFKNDVKQLQAQGKKIVLSIGGYEGYFSLTSQSAVSQFVSDIKSIVDEYGFDGIDIDLEQSSVTFNSGADPDYKNPVSPKIVNMIQAIRSICDSYGDDFILSWAPETFYVQLGYQFYGGLNAYCDSRAGVYLPMIHALRDKTSYVHVQLYNSMAITASDGKSYSMGNSEAVVAMCKMLLEGFTLSGNSSYFFEPLRADQVVIGVPSSAGAAGSGHISNESLQSAFTTLNKEYPGLRGIMTWSINWDSFQNQNSFAVSNGQFLHSLQ